MWAKAKLVRYADDFVLLSRHRSNRLTRWVESKLEGHFRLTINREKTRVVNLNQPGASLDFVGDTFRYDRDLRGRNHKYLNKFPSKQAQARARNRIREITSRQQNCLPITAVIRELNRWQLRAASGPSNCRF